MILAWSTTEVIRYAFYTLSLARNTVPGVLVYLRYTTFYILYPLGASSEALLILASLPVTNPLHGFKDGSWSIWDYFRGVMFVVWWPGVYSRSSIFPKADPWFFRPHRHDGTYGKTTEEGVWEKCRKHKNQVFLKGTGRGVHDLFLAAVPPCLAFRVSSLGLVEIYPL